MAAKRTDDSRPPRPRASVAQWLGLVLQLLGLILPIVYGIAYGGGWDASYWPNA